MTNPSPYLPAAQRALRPVRGLSIAVMTMLGLWCMVAAAGIVIDVLRIRLVDEVIAEATGVEALEVNDVMFAAAVLMQLAAFVVSGTLFIVWLYRARTNAEAATPTPNRRRRVWVILGWIVPVVNFWFPRQVVNDIWLASDPGTPAGGVDPTRRPGSLLVGWWWIFFICWAVLDRIASRSDRLADAGLETIRGEAILYAVTLSVGIVAAVLAMLVVRGISEFQETRRRVAGPVNW